MNFSEIASIIAGIAGITGGIVYLFKRFDWSLSKTPEEDKESIDQSEQDYIDSIKREGRP